VRAEGVRPQLVLEVTSPRLAQLDLADKVAIYQQAGIKEYLVLDAGLREEGDQPTNHGYSVFGYRLVHGQYEHIAPDNRGWIFSATTKVWLGPTEQRDNFIVVDQRTGEPITPVVEREEPAAAAYAEAASRAQSIASQLDFLKP
jgi:hypothetical protein